MAKLRVRLSDYGHQSPHLRPFDVPVVNVSPE